MSTGSEGDVDKSSANYYNSSVGPPAIPALLVGVERFSYLTMLFQDDPDIR